MRATAILAVICGAVLALTGCSRSAQEDAQPQGEAAQAESGEEMPQPGLEVQPADSMAPVSARGSVLDAILNSYSSKEFTAGEIDGGDLTAILEAGIKAPSARNLQPWHFSVIQDGEKVRQYVQAAAEGNVLIIVSGAVEEGEGVNVSLDCGLATENIYIAAQALGYGAHIYMAPAASMNQNKTELGIPDGYEATVAVLISLPGEGEDAVTGASARDPFAQLVTYVD